MVSIVRACTRTLQVGGEMTSEEERRGRGVGIHHWGKHWKHDGIVAGMIPVHPDAVVSLAEALLFIVVIYLVY